MTIHDIKAKKFNIPLADSFSYHTLTLTKLEYVLVEILSLKKQSGIGEAALAWDVTGETQDGSIAVVALICDIVRNSRVETVKDIEKIMGHIDNNLFGNTATKCAIESALFDLLGKQRKKPIYKLLNGKDKQWISFHKTFSFEESQNDLNKQMAFLVAQGVKLFKFKVGANEDKEAHMILSVRKNFPFVDIVLDANQTWDDYRDALFFLRQIRKARILWIEQPLKVHDYMGMQLMRRKINVKIMADESCHNLFDLEVLKKYNAVDLINIKLAKCGGLLAARKMIVFCEKHKIKYMLGDMIHSSVGTAYNLHAATLGNFITHDLTSPQRLKKDKAHGLVFNGFDVCIPEEHGLGVSLT